jgi:REP element-mobilizing transposase RayT
MNGEENSRRRRPLRLKGFDYAAAGAYFITIVTHNRSCLFGEINNGLMRLNSAGEEIRRYWFELNHKFANVEIDEFVIMPNHLHGIVVISDSLVGADLCVGLPVTRTPAYPTPPGAHIGAPLQKMVQWFKTMSTNAYIRGVRATGWPPFQIRLWQRNYYEHVIRGEESLNRIRQYILDNPTRWEFDRENPAAANISAPSTDP